MRKARELVGFSCIAHSTRHAYIYDDAHLYQDLAQDSVIRLAETLNAGIRWTFPVSNQTDKLKRKHIESELN